MVGTTLKRDLRPLHFKRRGQSWIAVDYRQQRSTEIARAQRAHRIEPGVRALDPGEAQVQHHPAAIGAYSQRDQHRYAHALFPDPHPWIPAVEKQVADLQLAEIPLCPRCQQSCESPPGDII
jgi:hypothetical protein